MDGIRALSTLERGSHSTVIMLTYTERKMAANCGLQMCTWNTPIHQLRCPRQARKEANEMAYFYGSESSAFVSDSRADSLSTQPCLAKRKRILL